MRYLIVGCGRVGSTLAKLLVAEHDVVVVDENPGAFKRLGARFGGGVEVGTGIDYDVLKVGDEINAIVAPDALAAFAATFSKARPAARLTA